MKFKEWLKLNEVRFKGFEREFRRQHPDMPRYVQRDLYNNRYGYTLKRLVSQNPDSRLAPTTPLGSRGLSRTSDSDIPNNSPSRIIDAQNLKDVSWSGPITINIHPTDFGEKTISIFLDRNFGFREDRRIRDDTNRMNRQREMMSQNTGNNEPVIILQNGNKLDLVEGWHRTMAVLLQGAPRDQLNLLSDPRKEAADYVNFHRWQRVPIRAYIGTNVAAPAA